VHHLVELRGEFLIDTVDPDLDVGFNIFLQSLARLDR